MNSSGKIIGIDFSAPKPQSMTESHLARHEFKTFCGYCRRTTYDFVSPDGAKHEAVRSRSNCIERMCGWWACKQLHDTTTFTSGHGPDFESKLTVECWRYCLCHYLDIAEHFCACAQMCGKSHVIKAQPQDTEIGKIVHPTCWETMCHCLFPGRNKVLLKTLLPDGTEKYYVRSDSTYVYYKLPVTAPNEQTPIAWITINAQKAWACNGLICCYCGHKKTGLLEVDHQQNLPFNERAHLMSAAMKMDDAWLLPLVGCCCNDP